MASKKKVKRPAKKKLQKKVKKPVKKPVKKLKNKKKPVKPAKKVLVAKKKVVKIKHKVKAIKPKKKVRKIAAHKKHRKQAPKRAASPDFSTESLFKAKIKVIGIGGGGGSIVSEIGRSLEKATFVVADTDLRALKKKPGIKYFWFGENLTRGLGTGVNVDLARQAAEEAKEKISGLFENQDIIIFIASLGGGLGSGATQVFAEAAKKFGAITFGIFTMPFKFEGKNKQKVANESLKQLRSILNVSITIPNENIFKLISADTPITSAFSIVNKNLIECLESLVDLIYNPGVINIDFADVRTILRGEGNLAFLNTVEQSGKDRADQVCARIFANPLYQKNNFEAQKILYNIAGGENLSMLEVEKISRNIADLNPKAKIIFGISKNQKFKNKIKATVLMTGPGAKSAGLQVETVRAKFLPAKAPAPEAVKKEANPELKPVKVLSKKEVKIKPESAKPKIKAKSKKKQPATKIGKKPQKTDVFGQPAEQLVPVFSGFSGRMAGVGEKRLNIVELEPDNAKKTIRRNALDIKKAQELEERKRDMQEKEWEIPAFLRKVKFKS